MIRNIHEAISRLAPADRALALEIVGSIGRLWNPDMVIAPDGLPYLFRWYLAGNPRQYIEVPRGLVMFHIQVASDPERPLHDHPWDHQSVILAGGYEEVLQTLPPYGAVERIVRKPGEVIWRYSYEAHRILLPDGVPYTMSLFTTGPKIRDWGFWYGDEWHHNTKHVATRADGVSIHVNRGEIA